MLFVRICKFSKYTNCYLQPRGARHNIQRGYKARVHFPCAGKITMLFFIRIYLSNSNNCRRAFPTWEINCSNFRWAETCSIVEVESCTGAEPDGLNCKCADVFIAGPETNERPGDGPASLCELIELATDCAAGVLQRWARLKYASASQRQSLTCS